MTRAAPAHPYTELGWYCGEYRSDRRRGSSSDDDDDMWGDDD